MKKISVAFVFPLLTLVVLVFALDRPILNIPALGRLLNPFVGAVQNEQLIREGMVGHLTGLSDEVKIYFDEREIPHVFAKNDGDLFFAQGYITASDRLWQMDFLSYAAAGRLSEIFGPSYLTYDRTQRRIGLYEAARKSLAYIEHNPEARAALERYTQGVNAFISKLSYSRFPFEYKLMNYKPEDWTNLKSVLIMKYIAAVLTGYEEDVSMSHMYLALGEQQFRRLYPEHVLSPLHSPAALASNISGLLPYKDVIDYSFLSSNPVVSESPYNPRLGSNSWVVSAARTKDGHPILCNDPHLNLSYPSIWYEIQLVSDSMSVYGVSIPGIPAVTLGFNKNVAWGITNGATDVRDWYKLETNNDYSAYKVGNKWLPTSKLIEKIKIKGQPDFIDTIHETAIGPIVIDKSFAQTPEVTGFALRWALHEPSDEFLTFIHLNKASNYPDLAQAIQGFKSPNLNFLFASVEGDIAIHHQGLLYDRLPGQGRFIRDGSDSLAIGQRMIDVHELPKLVNPAGGLVYSANNYPSFGDSSIYLNGYYAETRADRIQKLLDAGNDWTIAKMEEIQLDNTNQLATLAIPILLNALKGKTVKDPSGIIKQLENWDCRYKSADWLPVFFDAWLQAIKVGTWDELQRYSFNARLPDDLILLDLIKYTPDDLFFDKVETEAKETAGDVIASAFNEAAGKITKTGPVWGDLNKVNIVHLSGLAALGEGGIPSGSSLQAINAMGTNWGPSWRMIVELGTRPVAYGIFPGSRSGNRADGSFRRVVDDWIHGTYYKLNYFIDSTEGKTASKYTWILEN